MEKLERVLTYLEKMPPAIAGSNGDKATYQAAIACKRFGLTSSEIWTAMQWFNEHKCQPRWEEKELRHKVNGVIDLHVNKPLGGPAPSFSKRGHSTRVFVAPAPIVKKEDTRPVVERSPQDEEYWWEQVAASRGVTLPEWDETGEAVSE